VNDCRVAPCQHCRLPMSPVDFENPPRHYGWVHCGDTRLLQVLFDESPATVTLCICFIAIGEGSLTYGVAGAVGGLHAT
jgi:hypothetical protein